MGFMRYQPQGVARVAQRWASFIGATVFNANRNIATGASLSATQTLLPVGSGGIVALGSAQAIPLGLAVSASWSLLIVLRRDAQLTYPYFLGVLDGGAYKYAAIGANPDIGSRMAWYDGVGFQDSGFSQPLGSVDAIGLTFDGATGRYSWYKNGRAYNSTTGANNGGAGVWQLASISAQANTNTYPLLSIVPRAVPAADMLALTAQPWQLFDAPEEDYEQLAGALPASISGTLAATLPAPSMSATGSIINAGAFAATLAAPSMAASGFSATPPSGSFAATMAAPSMSAAGIATNYASFAATMAAPTMAATGTAAPHATGTFAVTMPAPTMNAFGYLGAVEPVPVVRRYRWRILRRNVP